VPDAGQVLNDLSGGQPARRLHDAAHVLVGVLEVRVEHGLHLGELRFGLEHG
jgi:hypothetical protein